MKGQILYDTPPLEEVPREVRFTETEDSHWCQGLCKGTEKQCLVETVSSGEMRKFWRWMVGMVAQQCE